MYWGPTKPVYTRVRRNFHTVRWPVSVRRSVWLQVTCDPSPLWDSVLMGGRVCVWGVVLTEPLLDPKYSSSGVSPTRVALLRCFSGNERTGLVVTVGVGVPTTWVHSQTPVVSYLRVEWVLPKTQGSRLPFRFVHRRRWGTLLRDVRRCFGVHWTNVGSGWRIGTANHYQVPSLSVRQLDEYTRVIRETGDDRDVVRPHWDECGRNPSYWSEIYSSVTGQGFKKDRVGGWLVERPVRSEQTWESSMPRVRIGEGYGSGGWWILTFRVCCYRRCEHHESWKVTWKVLDIYN